MTELPKALECEQTVLGAMIAYPKVTEKVIDVLKAKEFYSTSHKIIYEELCEMFNDGLVADLVTLTQRLNLKNKLTEAGSPSYLSDLMTGATLWENIDYHCDVIKDMSKRREIILYSREVMRQAYDKTISASNLIGEAAESLYSLTEVKGNTYKMEQCVDAFLQELDERIKLGGKLAGASTGFDKLDKVTGGLQKGEYIIIAARPSMGKTTFALNMAAHIAKKNNVMIFSFEMPKEQLLNKMVSSEAGVKLNLLRNGNVTDENIENIAQVSENLIGRNVTIYDGPALKVSEIRSMCMKQKMKEGLDVVIIDYIQLIRAEKESDNRNLEMSRISAELKSMAKELGINIIVLSQLSRGCEARADKRPMLSDLRDSGSLEQDADIIGFLYRHEYYYEAEDFEKNICELLIHKNRNGETGVLKFRWEGEYQRFSELRGKR